MSNKTKRNVIVPGNNKAVQDLAELNRITFPSKGYPDKHINEVASYLIRYEIVNPENEHAHDDAILLAQSARIVDGLEPFYNTPTIMVLDLENVAKKDSKALKRLNAWENPTYCDRMAKRTTISPEFLQNLKELSGQAFDFPDSNNTKPKGHNLS